MILIRNTQTGIYYSAPEGKSLDDLDLVPGEEAMEVEVKDARYEGSDRIAARQIIDLLTLMIDVNQETVHALSMQSRRAALGLVKAGVVHVNKHNRYQLVGTPCPVFTSVMRLDVGQKPVPIGCTVAVLVNGCIMPLVLLDEVVHTDHWEGVHIRLTPAQPKGYDLLQPGQKFHFGTIVDVGIFVGTGTVVCREDLE